MPTLRVFESLHLHLDGGFGAQFLLSSRAVAILILASCSGFYFWAKLKAQPLNTQRLRDTAGETSINTAQPKTLI